MIDLQNLNVVTTSVIYEIPRINKLWISTSNRIFRLFSSDKFMLCVIKEKERYEDRFRRRRHTNEKDIKGLREEREQDGLREESEMEIGSESLTGRN